MILIYALYVVKGSYTIQCQYTNCKRGIRPYIIVAIHAGEKTEEIHPRRNVVDQEEIGKQLYLIHAITVAINKMRLRIRRINNEDCTTVCWDTKTRDPNETY